MPATKDGFELQDGDVALVHSVYQLRLATIDHLAALSGRSLKALRARLLKLLRQKYLASPKRFRQKKVYALGNGAKPLLIDNGFASHDFANRRLRENELTETFIHHTLFASDILLKLLLQERTSPIKIIEIMHDGPALWDTAPGHDRNGKEFLFPVRPDFKLILRDTARPEGKNTLDGFFEADRGSMSGNDMEAKTRGYLAYHKSQRYHAKYPDMKMFQVFTVTRDRQRAAFLTARLAPILPDGPAKRAYHFTAIEDLTLEDLFPPLPSA